jgi:drug/metabolite transporter (DMT)-like permease
LLAVVVAPFAYLIPLSALTISHFWLGERVDATLAIGALLVLTGLALTQVRNFVLLARAQPAMTDS